MAALLSQHIHSLPLGQFQNVLGREKIVSDFLAFFSSLEALGISQDQYGDFVQQLDNGTMEYEYVKVQRELYEAFKAFRKLCEQQGVTHWNAVVSEALRILDSSPILVDQLVNDFPHIVVDDFSEMTPAMLLVPGFSLSPWLKVLIRLGFAEIGQGIESEEFGRTLRTS